MTREPFPLQWPDGWPRTEPDARVRSQFGIGHKGDVPFSCAFQELREELSRLGAANWSITTDLPLNSRGIPYASSAKSGDVGVAAWFFLADARGNMQERVNACDRYRTVAENMTAIARTIEALRGIERWGAADVVTRAFAGFTALPPGSGEEFVPPAPAPKRRPWREVIGGVWPDELDAGELLVLVKTRYRKRIAEVHPDKGGAQDAAAELNVAVADAELELGAR